MKITIELGKLILELREKGLGQRSIADIIGVDRSTIQDFYHRNNIINQPLKKINLNELLNTKEVKKIINKINNQIEQEKANKISEYFPPEEEVIKLINEGWGYLSVAKKLRANETYVYKIFKSLNLDKKARKKDGHLRAAHLMTEKMCAFCKETLDISNFYKYIRKDGRIKNAAYCHNCRKIKQHKYINEKRLNDPVFHLKELISKQIYDALKKNGSSKDGKSCLQYLPYNIQELKEHIEKLFSHPDNLTPDGYIWMNWDNHGLYNINNWNDRDPSTWTWQLDHIIPHSLFKYTALEDPKLQECWTLSNLRPYSAKQNILDGATKVRHLCQN